MTEEGTTDADGIDPRPIKGTVSFSELKTSGGLPDTSEIEVSMEHPPATTDLNPTTADEFGEICHEVLHRGAGGATTVADWRRECDRVLARIDPSENTAERVLTVVTGLGPRLAQLGTVEYTERTFGFRCNGWYVTGDIDALIVRDNGRVIVLDFKTGAPANIHPFQLSLYILACERDVSLRTKLPGPVTDGAFLLVDGNGTTTLISLEETDAPVELTAIERELVATLDAFETKAKQFERYSTEMDCSSSSLITSRHRSRVSTTGVHRRS